MDVKAVRERFLRHCSTVMPRDTYKALSESLSRLTDRDFENFLKVMSKADENNGGFDLGDYYTLSQKAMDAYGTTAENAAFNDVPIQFMDENKNRKIVKKINKSVPSDTIFLTGKQDNSIMDSWEPSDAVSKGRVMIPSDIFLEGGVTILDCVIRIDESDLEPPGVICEARVCIFKDYLERICNDGFNSVVPVGCVIYAIPNVGCSIYAPIHVTLGCDCVLSGPLGWVDATKDFRNYVTKTITAGVFKRMAGSMLETWYGVQKIVAKSSKRDSPNAAIAEFFNGMSKGDGKI